MKFSLKMSFSFQREAESVKIQSGGYHVLCKMYSTDSSRNKSEDSPMKIGIIDADLIGRSKHRFPNLACEKISGYWKDQGAEVQLLLDYNGTATSTMFTSPRFLQIHQSPILWRN